MEKVYIQQGSIIKLFPNEYSIIKRILDNNGIKVSDDNFQENFVQFPQSYVGYISMPNRKIIIKSKMQGLEMRHILRMYYLVFFNDEIDCSDSFFNIADGSTESIVAIYVEELVRILKIGLPVEYSLARENSRFLKGKINAHNTIMNLCLNESKPFDCEFDYLSKDIPVNQLLYSAYKKIEALVDDNIKGFINCSFQSISRIDRVKEKPIITRNLKYCEKAILLAYMILNDLSINGIGESDFGENLLINIDDLYEKFVQRVLISYSNDDKFMRWDYKHKYGDYYKDEEDVIKEYAPDLLYGYSKYLSKEKATCVLDMKNKVSSPFNSSDVYQMCFYASMLDCNKVILCYPSTNIEATKKLNLYNDGIKLSSIYAVYVKLTSDSSEDFRSNIEEFIKEVLRVIDI